MIHQKRIDMREICPQLALKIPDIGVLRSMRLKHYVASGVVVYLSQRFIDMGDSLFDGFALAVVAGFNRKMTVAESFTTHGVKALEIGSMIGISRGVEQYPGLVARTLGRLAPGLDSAQFPGFFRKFLFCPA